MQLFWHICLTTGILHTPAFLRMLQILFGMLFLHGLNCGGFSVGGGGFVDPGFGFLVQYGWHNFLQEYLTYLFLHCPSFFRRLHCLPGSLFLQNGLPGLTGRVTGGFVGLVAGFVGLTGGLTGF